MSSSGMDYLGLPLTSTSDSSSWTDDLPICNETGVGFSPNQIYRRDGYRNSEHELEDQSFHFRPDDQTALYGVFDGHCGSRAANFAVQRIPAEILLGQLSEESTEEEIHEVLQQAFFSVEREFFADTIGQSLAERTALISEISDVMKIDESIKDYPELQTRLEALNRDVASGTTAIVVLIFNGKIYVSNVGDSRALICRVDPNNVLRVIQLSTDHDLTNEEELGRIRRLGIDPANLRNRLGSQDKTRCLGNYLVKGGYKEMDHLRGALGEPVIAQPDIYPSVTLDDSCQFLILFSNGLVRAFGEAFQSNQVNIHLTQMIIDEFKVQSTLNGVAQAVVDKVSRAHHETFTTRPNHGKRDDMTLLIRNFNHPLPRSQNLYESVNSDSPTNRRRPPNHFDVSISTMIGDNLSDTTSTESDFPPNLNVIPLDQDGRVEPYVDFANYFNAVESDPGLVDYFNKLLDPEMTLSPIDETGSS